MKKIYHLSTCDTCKRIINQLDIDDTVTLQDIKKEEITVKQLDEMKKLARSYEALFSKRAKLYKERGLKDHKLSEDDIKGLILEHYTFLKRPVIINGNEIFIGNSKKIIEAAKNSFH